MPAEAAIDAFIQESIAQDITQIEQTTIAAVQAQVLQAEQQGLTVESLRQAITDVFTGFTSQRALTIARTEVGSAASFGQLVGATLAGATQKIWLTSRDEHVRTAHDSMEQETVMVDGIFSNGGRFPSDPGLSAEQRINCRCAMSFR